jgi:hypothetical protein
MQRMTLRVEPTIHGEFGDRWSGMRTAVPGSMTGQPKSVLARIRARVRAELEAEEKSGERERFEATPTQKLEWLGSKTLRAPTRGHVDVVVLGKRSRG